MHATLLKSIIVFVLLLTAKIDFVHCQDKSIRAVELTNLLCDKKVAPQTIIKKPGFSWQIKTEQQNFLQTAFQVFVSDNPTTLKQGKGNSWNSGKVTSDQSINVMYRGVDLKPSQTYYWSVKIWDNSNKTYQSKVDSFSTALFTKEDWNQAVWIGYEDLPDSMRVVPGVHAPHAKQLGNRAIKRSVVPLFRKQFSLNKPIRKATAYITGLGQYEFSMNGKKVGNSFLAPAWTDYEKRIQYNVYDITGHLTNGINAIGVMVGNGFYYINRERYFKIVTAYGFPKLICKILIEYHDGSKESIVSDESWTTSASPITYSSIFGGEDFDAQKTQSGWDNRGFDDRSWKQALKVATPRGALEPESIYPITIKDSFDVSKIIQPREGVFVYDFGQNASGIIRIQLKGKKGQVIKLTPAELLDSAMLPNQRASGAPYYYTYTCSGDSIETWQPRFSYYGFRYVRVEGAVPAELAKNNDVTLILNMKELHNSSSSPETGKITTSADLFNKTNNLIKWAIQSNLQSVVTDCPHREKLSWLEQDYLMGKSIHYNFDIYHLYRSLVYNMMDAQTADGLVPDIAPEFVPFEGGFRDSPEWGSASVILPWQIYKWYGDTAIIRAAYPMMKRYIGYLESKSNNHILSHGLGDWFDYGPRSPGEAQLTPKELTATAIYFYDVTLLAKMAAMIGETKESETLKSKAADIKTAFNNRFFNKTSKVYSTGSQTAMAMPISVGLVNVEDRPGVLKNLVDSINSSGRKLTAGDVGYHFLVDALHQAGASQLLYDMNARDDVPGYGFQLKKGATALTESWPALEEVSNNHLMLGHIMEWFYYGLAGIDQSDSSVAYKDIIIKPEVVGDLTHVNGSFQSPYGVITSEWKLTGKRFELNVNIPPNTSATVFVPATEGALILVNGRVIKKREDKTPGLIQESKFKVRLGSGKYSMVVHND